jgi:hypothetical protein
VIAIAAVVFEFYGRYHNGCEFECVAVDFGFCGTTQLHYPVESFAIAVYSSAQREIP